MSIASEQSSSDIHRSSLSNNSSDSIISDTQWGNSGFGPNRLGRGSMLFTGPDGIRDHRQKVVVDYRYVGEGTLSPEGSSESGYLWRSPVNTPHPRPKSRTVGEIGWGVSDNFNWFSSADTGAQMQLGEFRQFAEDRHTHSYQSAWSPQVADKSDVLKTPGDDQSQSRTVDKQRVQSASTSPIDVTPKASFQNTGVLGQTKSGEELLTSGSDNSIGNSRY